MLQGKEEAKVESKDLKQQLEHTKLEYETVVAEKSEIKATIDV